MSLSAVAVLSLGAMWVVQLAGAGRPDTFLVYRSWDSASIMMGTLKRTVASIVQLNQCSVSNKSPVIAASA